MSFIVNKYYKWYFQIINKASTLNRKKGNGFYYELHHIIPKCLEGSNKKENLVLLTAREHFICHVLLCKMVIYKSSAYYKLLHGALYFKGKNKNRKESYISARLYEQLRKEKSELLRLKNNNAADDASRRKKISETMLKIGKFQDKSYFKTEEWKKKARENGRRGVAARRQKKIERMKDFPESVRSFKNNIKKKVVFSKCWITKNGRMKETTINQIPQYKKYGWVRVLVPPAGIEPA